ncbi:MAG: carboxypeptidase-like regulatory domain-containing protein [Kofleriaceae bacterium]
MTTRTRQVLLLVAIVAAIFVALVVVRGRRADAPTPSRAGAGATTASATTVVSAAALPPRQDPRALPLASIAGTVVDAAAGPLAGATVCASYAAGELSREETREPTCATTSADGSYRLERLPTGTWYVEASAAEHQPRRWRGAPPDEDARLRLAAGEARTGVDLTLTGGAGRVVGRVADVNGGPVADAVVEIAVGDVWARFGGASASASAYARSADDGTFTAWVRPGLVEATATADGYAVGSSSATAPTELLEILLTPASALAGIVVEAGTDRPVAGAEVAVRPDWDEGDFNGGGSAITDEAGRFRITRLAPGRYKPTATARGWYGEPIQSVLLGLAESADDVRIEVHPMATITGTVVVDDGSGGTRPCPEGDCHLSLTGTRGEGMLGATTKADGTVVFEAARPGTYAATVWSQRYLGEDVYPDVVVAAAPLSGLVWKVRSGTELVGTIRDRSGTALAEIGVTARSVGGDGRGQMVWSSDETDADGAYQLRALAPGDYELTVRSEVHPQPEPAPRVTIAAGAPQRLDLVLDAGGVLAGVVVDSSGRGVRGANVYLQGTRWRSRQGRSSDDGTFRIEGISPDDYRVVAWRAGGGTMRKPGSTDDDVQGERVKIASGKTASVRLVVESQDGKITGTVTTSAGAPVADAYLVAARESMAAGVDAARATQRTRWSWDQRPVVTDTDGSFTVNGLAPGTYTLRAYRKGGGEAVVEHVAIGASARLVIRATGSVAGTVTTDAGPPEQLAVSLLDEVSGFERSESFFLHRRCSHPGRRPGRHLPAARQPRAPRAPPTSPSPRTRRSPA